MANKMKLCSCILVIFIMIGACGRSPEAAIETVPETGTIQETSVSETAMTDETTAELTASKPQLSPEDQEKIEYLLVVLRNTLWFDPIESFLTDNPVLNDESEEIELDRQARFLASLYDSRAVEEIAAILDGMVHNIDIEAETLTLTIEEANQLIRMAGGIPNAGLGSYLENEYYAVEGNEDLFTFVHYPEDIHWRNEITEFIYLEDESIKVTGQSKAGWEVTGEDPDFQLLDGAILTFEAILVPNEKSIFGGYSVKHLRHDIVHPAGTENIGEKTILQPYQRPEALSPYSFDYIFTLDGALYQMPFPVQEFTANGWVLEEEGVLEPGGRATIHVIKDGMKLSGAIWNYNQELADFNECTVVWLKTSADATWADVAFHVDGIDNNSAVQFYSLDDYSKRDPLYNDMYGFTIQLENRMIVGFEMGYAPNPKGRKERAALLMSDWEKDPIYAGAVSNELDIVFNQIYQIDIDQDGKKEAVVLKYLDNVEWGENRLCILIDGEATAVINGEYFNIEKVKFLIEEQGVCLSVEGTYNHGRSTRKFLLHKKQSEELPDEDMPYQIEIGGQMVWSNATELELINCGISDLTPLKELANLTSLNLNGNKITDVSPLESLTNLSILHLNENKVSDLMPLQSLTNLTILNLNSNQLSDSDIIPLQSLVNLRILNLRWNQISDLTPLQSMVKLEILMLDNNPISDLTPLQPLTSLKILQFYGGAVSDITPLAGMTKLEKLSCIGNQITDLTPLENMMNLKTLTLWGNPISDITPLKSLTGIAEISLEGAPLTQAQVDELQAALPDCQIDFPENPRIWE